MRSLLLLALISLSLSVVEKKSEVKPLPVLECLLTSDIIVKDVTAVYKAIKKYSEDKDILALISTVMAVYPELEAEVTRCLKAEIVLEKGNIPAKIKKIWDSIPKHTQDLIKNAAKLLGKRVAEKSCKKLIKDDEICSLITDYIDDL
jgi:NurA-like 5'-3' nuclease